jgi:O-antigen ligase
MLHLFATRTGLVSFYITLFILGIISVQKINKVKNIIYIICIILLSPVLVYFLFPSIQNRIHNSIIDANQFYEGNDLSNWSLARRLAAWQTTWHVIIEKPILGVGAGAVEKALQLQYDKEQFILKPESRVMPHNQFLETWISLGLVGLANLLLILYFFIFYIGSHLKSNTVHFSISYLRLSFFIACISAMLVESILERQIGVSFFCYFALLLVSYEPESANNHAI